MKRILMALTLVLMLFVAGCDELPEDIEQEIPEYTIEFMSNDETYQSMEVTVGDMILPPDDPSLDGYDFMGWYVDETTNHPFGFGAMPNQDIVLYAKWEETPVELEATYITVSFDSLGGSVVADEQIESGTQFNPDIIPEKVGFKFSGWYMDENCYYQFPFINGFTEDITLYAKWEKDILTLQFYAEGVIIEQINLIYDEIIHDEYIPEVPYKEGYSGSWDTEIPHQISTNMTINAVYEINSYDLYIYQKIDADIEMVLSANEDYVVITDIGDIWYWGESHSLSLLNEPMDLDEGEEIIKADAEEDHMVFLTSNGKVKVLNTVNSPFLGIDYSGYEAIHDVTSNYALYPDEEIIDVKLTTSNLFVLTNLGRVIVQGENTESTSGLGNSLAVDVATEIDFSGVINETEKIIGLETGPDKALVYTDENHIFIWGKEIGDDVFIRTKLSPFDVSFTMPVGESIEKIGVGHGHVVALTTDKSLFGFGKSYQNQLGSGSTFYFEFVDLGYMFEGDMGNPVLDFYVGENTTYFLHDDGLYTSYGANSLGELCNGEFTAYEENAEAFRDMPFRENEHISTIYPNDTGGFIVSDFGDLYGWGDDELGQFMVVNLYETAEGHYLGSLFYDRFMLIDQRVVVYGTVLDLPIADDIIGHDLIGWGHNKTFVDGVWVPVIYDTMPATGYAVYTFYISEHFTEEE